MSDGTASKLRKVRDLPADVEAPVFKLGGAAIGNGFTDAVEQTLVQVRHAASLSAMLAFSSLAKKQWQR